MGVTCFKCRSIENNNPGCNDPFRGNGYISWPSQSATPTRVERRQCPPFEKCVKITGLNYNSQYFTIRDCYKTNYFSGSYRERRISYYNEAVDGEISICNVNLCNIANFIQISFWSLTLCVILVLIQQIN